MNEGDHHKPLGRMSEREMRKSVDRSSRGLDPGDYPQSMEERWQREVDGRPTVGDDTKNDPLLDALIREHQDRWRKVCFDEIKRAAAQAGTPPTRE